MRYIPLEKLRSNSTNGMESLTSRRTDDRKEENYIPLGINAGGIISSFMQKQRPKYCEKYHFGAGN